MFHQSLCCVVMVARAGLRHAAVEERNQLNMKKADYFISVEIFFTTIYFTSFFPFLVLPNSHQPNILPSRPLTCCH